VKKIRRKDREISSEEAKRLLAEGEYGFLSTAGANGKPYGVPLSYACLKGSIYFHCARAGHKLENIAHNPTVSFSVVGRTKVLPDQFATEYESVIVFGTACEVEGAEKLDALLGLLEKYSPGFIEEGKRYIEQMDSATKVFRIDIENLTGKGRR
jgi:hypothetical protein